MEGFKHRVRRLQTILRRRGQTHEDAEDLIQEAFLRLHVYCQSQEVREHEAFLTRTTLNLSVDRHRKAHSDLYSGEAIENLLLVDLRPTPDEELATQERLSQVGVVLDALAPRTREVFLMHRVEGNSCGQIAKAFGISVSAVEKHIARAVLALMEMDEE